MIELLENINFNDLRAFGGKASMLSLMLKNEVAVPKGLVISTEEFFNVIGHSSIKDVVDRFWNTNSLDIIISDAKQIKEFIKSTDISMLAEKARKIIAKIFVDSDKLIYRSSATSEDGKAFSFAGQFLSELGWIDDLEVRIKEIWCSVFENNVKAYVKNINAEHIDWNHLGMCVIIQQFYDFGICGVLFSRHPTLNLKNWLFAEYSDQPLQKIVHGELIPSRARINVITKQVLYESGDDLTLSEYNVSEVIAYTNRLRTALGYEVDIEWGICEDEAIFVQCRPITTN